jgi:tRNA-uridine 2-sulfurtransferase
VDNKSKKLNKKVVLVAMSGGVDSSVAAALLKKQGFYVVGIFFDLWKEKKGKLADGKKGAGEIAKILEIPLKIVDLSKEFKKEVIDQMLQEFDMGKTPNPCVICNPEIKFATLLKLSKKYKADYVATGHYAQNMKHEAWNTEQNKNRLFEAKDKTKDQSYFLYGLSQKQLSKIIFPLGRYKKTEVKIMAEKMGLPVFDREESHDVCFVPGKLDEYLKKKLKLRKGKMVDQKGKVLGEHRGIPLYTIGQRKGIDLGGSGPYYVIDKNVGKNEIVITDQEEDGRLYNKIMLVEKVSWINKPANFPLNVKVRIRYLHPAVHAIISKSKKQQATPNVVMIKFRRSQRAITPGQSAVIYGKKGEVLGGGIIN